MYCPKCEKLNKCNCKSCNPKGEVKDVVILDLENKLYQCYFCHYKFSESESMDYEWDKMVKGFADDISPQQCLDWCSSTSREKKETEKSSGFGETGYTYAFVYHFKTHPNNCNKSTISKFQRNLSLNNILDDK